MHDATPERLDTASFRFTADDTQAVKGVAILLMIWHHLFGFPQYFAYDTLLPVNLAFYLGRFGKVCVAVYLFLSGFGLAQSAMRKDRPATSTWVRLRRFYAQYWFYLALCVPYGLWSIQTGRFAPDVRLFLTNVAGMADHHHAYDLAWWFVRVYVPLLVLFPLIFRVARRQPYLLPVLGLGLLGVQTRIWEGTLVGGVLYWQMPFVLGVFCAVAGLFSSRPAQRASEQPAWWHAAVLLSLFLFRFRAGGGCDYDFLIAPLFAFSAACLVRKLRVSKPFVFLGELSLPLWLTHGFLCYSYATHLVYAPRYPALIFPLLLALNLPLVLLAEGVRRRLDVPMSRLFGRGIMCRRGPSLPPSAA